MIRIVPVVALGLVVVGCVTIGEEATPVATAHPGMEPRFTIADADTSGDLTKEEERQLHEVLREIRFGWRFAPLLEGHRRQGTHRAARDDVFAADLREGIFLSGR